MTRMKDLAITELADILFEDRIGYLEISSAPGEYRSALAINTHHRAAVEKIVEADGLPFSFRETSKGLTLVEPTEF